MPDLSDLTGYVFGRGGGWPHTFQNGYMATKERIETTSVYNVIPDVEKHLWIVPETEHWTYPEHYAQTNELQFLNDYQNLMGKLYQHS